MIWKMAPCWFRLMCRASQKIFRLLLKSSRRRPLLFVHLPTHRVNALPCCQQVEPKAAVTALIKAHDAFVPRRIHRAEQQLCKQLPTLSRETALFPGGEEQVQVQQRQALRLLTDFIFGLPICVQASFTNVCCVC